MWVLIATGIAAVIIGLAGVYAIRSGRRPLEPMSAGMLAGGVVGVTIGILLVEFAGLEYPSPSYSGCWEWPRGR